MKIYCFKTFTTSYYFPKIDNDYKFLYGLYSAYGRKLSRIYWWLFRHCQFVRAISAVDPLNAKIDYDVISRLVGGRSVMSFNMGSPGPLQKTSILGYNTIDGLPFFAKYSVKPKAMELTKNEIMVYKKLSGSGIVPHLYDYKIDQEYVWMKTEYIEGKRMEEPNMNEKIFNLSMLLSRYHLTESSVDGNGLLLCLSHGDFCPWNMLVHGKDIKLIDWEQAADRPLGFDLFTYIAQVTNLIYPNVTLDVAMKNHEDYIKRYFLKFDINDWSDYLKAFAIETKAFKEMKGSYDIAVRYDCLLK